MKRFVFFHNKKHPIEMGEKEIEEFISRLEKMKKSPHQLRIKLYVQFFIKMY
ncbi:phage integrase N-terminal SAM-like domain-containing protein [Chloroherpeton thalassium]|uniref:phage integrase N-terminal SAM-like domain-containing protein n=1 Tax=Chloroherpeton thalassium TaxID=100716 RepID=UPI0034E93B25